MHVSTNLDVDLVAVEAADQVNLLLELQAPQLPEQATRAEQTLVVVLDRSGSMSGRPLEASRRALTTLIGRLDPRDRFGLVIFDDHADVVVPTASLESLGADKVRDAIAGIGSGGCTDLSAGYLLGLSEAGRAMDDGGATVLLISDGHANSGETSPQILGTLAEGRASRRSRPRPSVSGWGMTRSCWSPWPGAATATTSSPRTSTSFIPRSPNRSAGSWRRRSPRPASRSGRWGLAWPGSQSCTTSPSPAASPTPS